MAKKIACTNCEQVVDADYLVGWIETDVMNLQSVLGVAPPAGQFCCEACLVKWFTDRQAKVINAHR